MMFRLAIYILFIPLLMSTSCGKYMGAHSGQLKKKEKSKTAEHYFSTGMKHYILEEMNEAETWFEKSYEINPENAGLNFMMAKVKAEKKDYNSALLYAQKAIKANKENPYYYELLAEVYKEQSNISEATKVYEKMVSEFPEDQGYHLNLAALYLYQRKTGEALKVYQNVEDKFGKSPELYKQKQELYVRLDNYEAALNEAKELADSYPGNTSYKLSYAEMLLKYDKKEEAKAVLNEVREKDPENPYASLILANLHKEKGEYNKYFDMLYEVFRNPEMGLDTKVNLLSEVRGTGANGKQQISKLAGAMLDTHPDSPLAHSAVGDLLIANGQKREAWEQYLKAIHLDDSNFSLWTQLIILDSDLNELDSMLHHSEEALEVYPNQAALWYLNGSAYLQNKKPEDAVASLEHGKRLAGDNQQLLMQFNIMLGDSYNDLKEYESSDEAYDAALAIDSNNPHILNNYSYFLSLRNEKLEKALEMSEKLMSLAPDNAAYMDTHAWVLYKLGKYEEAKQYLEKAIENTNDGTIVEHYGDVLFKLGEKDKAVNEWIKARKLGGVSGKIDKKIADKKLYE